MKEQFARTALLLGEEAVARLEGAHVAVFGVGGVGSFTVEALARCGLGALSLFDADVVAPSNLNRQLIATLPTIGMQKVDAAKARILEINPDCRVSAHVLFYSPDNAENVDLAGFDYVVDAIDTVASKLELIVRAREAGTPVISSMGAGNKLDPTRFEVADLYETSVCPLARVMRRELKKRGILKLKVVYSKEEATKPRQARAADLPESGPVIKRQIPGSVPFVPSVAGLILAGEVVKDLILSDHAKREA